MKHFFSNKVRIVLIVAVLLAIAVTVVSSLLGVNLPEVAVKGILAPLRAGGPAGGRCPPGGLHVP